MFKGKAIYNPAGKASEYSEWACNFYVGCSNQCTYCYLKKGRGSKILGGNKPELKKCFKNEDHAISIFIDELLKNKDELKEHGLFFSFSTDPMLKETKDITIRAVHICNSMRIPVKILTKKVDYILQLEKLDLDRRIVAIGATLTGADELETYASLNMDRINMLGIMKSIGFKTFASIEPIISFRKSRMVMDNASEYVDLFKVGLESGGKYDVAEAQSFVEWMSDEFKLTDVYIYMKESLQKLTGHKNETLGHPFVVRNYNIFNG